MTAVTAQKHTIPRHLSLVPASPYQLAVWSAISEVEGNGSATARGGQHPYASAFFRQYCGTRKINSTHIRRLIPQYSPRTRQGASAAEYMDALDQLIESRGDSCPLPLSSDMVLRLFPEKAVRRHERIERRIENRLKIAENSDARKKEQKRRRYQTRLAQAEIDLAFNTPETVSAWYSHWQHMDLHESDLQGLICAWLVRFPSMRNIDTREWEGEALWQIMFDLQCIARELQPEARHTDRMLVPNKLTAQGV